MKAARVAAHVHSSWSYDAQWSLPDIARAFRRHRYDAVLMAEHDRSFDEHKWADYRLACQEASTGGILLVPGIEYEDSDGVVHVPVWGEAVPFLGAGRPTLDLLRSARDQNAIAVLAHPWRRNAISRYQPEWGGLLSAGRALPRSCRSTFTPDASFSPSPCHSRWRQSRRRSRW
jgi:predicted metal-dependent phosphoesterase TrpH